MSVEAIDNSPLEIVRGSATTVRFNLLDERDEVENIVGASSANMIIRKDAGGAVVFTKSSSTINTTRAEVDFVLTDSETINLAVGLWVLSFSIIIGSDTYKAQPQLVRVINP